MFDLCVTLLDNRQGPAGEGRGHQAFLLGNVSSSELTAHHETWTAHSSDLRVWAPSWVGWQGFFSQPGDNSVLLSLIFKKNLLSWDKNNYEKLLLTDYDRSGRWERTNTERDIVCVSYQMSCYYSRSPWNRNFLKKKIIFRKIRVPKSSQPIKGTYYHLHFTERSFGLHDTPNVNPLAIFTLKQNLPTCCWNTIQKGKYVDLY